MDFAKARRAMVDSQLRVNGVVDEGVLLAMGDLSRERFVPPRLRSVAYVDDQLTLGAGRSLAQPYLIARLLQACAITAQDTVLVVGGATGYTAAVASRLGSCVFLLENETSFAQKAQSLFIDMEIENILVVEVPLEEGYPACQPYDVILFDGAVEVLPEALMEQAAMGARLACVLQAPGGVGQATLVTKTPQGFLRTSLFETHLDSLPSFERVPLFSLGRA